MYDPKIEYNEHKADIDNAINTVLNHGLFINGPEVKELEKRLAEYVNVKHAICVSNGTDAIKLALLALDIGIDDEVITVSHTWISTAEAISIINAKPVFVDIDINSFNIDGDKIEEKITSKTKAILVVSLYGQTPDIDKINNIANKYSLPVIEDGAQSFGALYKGKKSGGLTTIGTTSFFPSKPLGCYGDGGACFTDDDTLALKIRALKNHGCIKRFKHQYIGINARLDTIQAAILNVKLSYFDKTIEKRNECANYYSEKLKNISSIVLPKISADNTSVWSQYSIFAESKSIRDSVVSFLKDKNINVAIFYPSPLHTQECFRYLDNKHILPATECVSDRIFNLPCYGELSRIDQDRVISLLLEFFTPHEQLN